MAEKILYRTLSAELTVDQLLKWLKSSESLQDDNNISRGEFVTYFLNYLRRSTSWLFQNPENGVEEPSVEIARPTSSIENRLSSSSIPLKKIDLNNSSSFAHNDDQKNRRAKKKNGKFREAVIAEKKSSPDIDDLGAFPPLDGSPSKVRRINPTPLAHIHPNSAKRTLHNSFKKSSESIVLNSVFCPPYAAKRNSSTSERHLLKVAKENFVRQPTTISSHALSIAVKSKDAINAAVFDTAVHILPSLSLVTYKNSLDEVVKVYNGLLAHGLVPNITSELHFIFQLLSSSVRVSDSSNSLFGNIHNCVYFAIRILENNEGFMELLDNSTLVALLKIPYLPGFSCQLAKLLESNIRDKNAVKIFSQSSIEEVAFREDIDTRRNFPSNECFSSFSKQRDMFYEIFEEWQLNCMKDAWCESWFKKKVCKLLELSVDPMNYFSLARLIKSHILISCLHGDEELKNHLHDRFDILQDRISVQRGNHCPPPTFPGAQGFFEAFLKAANSDSLNRYLQDVFAFDIVEQNDGNSHFHTQNMCDARIQTKFAAHLRHLRLLAKFFGFVTFLPYKSSRIYQESLLDAQKDYRKVRQQPIDLLAVLNDAIQNHQLVLTVPWVVEYLSMMDQVASLIEQNILLCQLLVSIYQGIHRECLTNLNYQFLRVIIGWFIEKPQFPLQQLYCHDEFVLQNSEPCPGKMNCLDCNDIVDKSLVYSCCSYLSELRVMLENKDVYIKRSIPDIRKITPLSTNTHNNILNSKERLQKSLIENFYFLQPVVVKKIVEFSSERICSRFVHRINQKLEKLKAECVGHISTKYTLQIVNVENAGVMSLIFDACLKLCCEGRRYVQHYIDTKSYPDIKKLLLFLMAEEFSQPVIDVSCGLAAKSVKEFLVNWINCNLVPETMKIDIRNKVNKSMKKKVAMALTKVVPPDSDFEVSSTQILTRLKKLLTLLKCDAKNFPVQGLLGVCEEICFAIDRGHLRDSLTVIVRITRELMMALVVHVPKTCKVNLMMQFISLWMRFEPRCIKLNQFISPFSLFYLEHCCLGSDSWAKLGLLVDLLLESNLISLEDVRYCLYDLDRDRLSESILSSFQDCMMPVIEKHVRKDSADKQFCDLFYLLQLKFVTSN